MSQILDQLTLNIKLEDSISLDKFIVCESNKHSLQFIENSLTEDSISNLFYIWGEEGVGKSYLMKAINKEYRKLNFYNVFIKLREQIRQKREGFSAFKF